MSSVSRVARSFAVGFWEFLVGGLPEIPVATFAVVGVAFAARSVNTLAIVVLPLLVMSALATSIRLRASRRRRS
jgi:hypothetical protein